VLLTGCAAPSRTSVAPVPFALPDSTVLVDGPSGAPVSTADLLRRARAADIVLLGEVHDNPTDMAVRAGIITALADRHPAIVFEQFPESDTPIAPPQPGDSLEGWLDRSGFDRHGWKWPMHRPVIEAALAHARSLWGANVSRAQLMPVVENGESAAPDSLRPLMDRAPLGDAARAVLDSELVDGHCHQLPAEMIPGMRTAQIVRDAAMTRALLLAGATGPAWLIAGNGHVRRDVDVPRLLKVAAPGKTVLAVGILEREENGAGPDPAERAAYDLVIVTPRVPREDPCAQFRRGM